MLSNEIHKINVCIWTVCKKQKGRKYQLVTPRLAPKPPRHTLSQQHQTRNKKGDNLSSPYADGSRRRLQVKNMFAVIMTPQGSAPVEGGGRRLGFKPRKTLCCCTYFPRLFALIISASREAWGFCLPFIFHRRATFIFF